MKMFRALITAAVCSLVCASVMVHASGQAKPAQQTRPPAQPPADQKRLAFNRTCAAEIKAAGARGARMADMFYKDMSNNSDGRDELMQQLPAEVRDSRDEERRAVNLIAACAILVTHAWEHGERTRAALAEAWTSARAELEAVAAAPFIETDRYVPVTRSVCLAELLAMVTSLEKSGTPREDAMTRGTETVEDHAVPGQARDDLLRDGATRARQTMAPGERETLRASLCSAVTGAAVDGGMTDPDELRAFWATRKTSLFPRIRSDESRVQCATIDQGTAKGSEPILLRNTCTFAINAGFCMSGVPAGSPTEVVACEKNRFETHEIGPKGAALIDNVDGKVYRQAACRAPAVPTLYIAQDGTSKFDCWLK